MFLFLLGLLTGLVEQNLANQRMGLAAHLEGVMNGTFLLALGAIWTRVRLSRRWYRDVDTLALRQQCGIP
jgi:hydroxylaminobenzene mutase